MAGGGGYVGSRVEHVSDLQNSARLLNEYSRDNFIEVG